MQHAGGLQPLRHEPRATSAVQVYRHEAAARLQVGQQRDACTDAIEILERQFDARLAGDGHQVQHRVGRTAGGRDGRDGVLQ